VEFSVMWKTNITNSNLTLWVPLKGRPMCGDGSLKR
jgi:hypothetical protein